MKIPYSLLLLFIVLPSLVYAKYIEGRLIFKDGSKKSGFIEFKEPYDETIQFKASKDAAEISYKSEDIIELIMISEGKEYRFHRLSTLRPRLKKDTVVNPPAWLMLHKDGYTKLYLGGAYYKVKDGVLSITYGSFLYTLAWRPGEKAASVVRIYADNTAGLNKGFRAMTSAYFKDYPELVKRIENEEFDHKQLEDLVAIYDQWKVKQLQKKK